SRQGLAGDATPAYDAGTLGAAGAMGGGGGAIACGAFGATGGGGAFGGLGGAGGAGAAGGSGSGASFGTVTCVLLALRSRRKLIVTFSPAGRPRSAAIASRGFPTGLPSMRWITSPAWSPDNSPFDSTSTPWSVPK